MFKETMGRELKVSAEIVSAGVSLAENPALAARLKSLSPLLASSKAQRPLDSVAAQAAAPANTVA